MRRLYPTDLSDAEWACLEEYLPSPENDGRPRVHSLREILDAIFYIVKSGCPWRLLPHDFPPWKTVYHYFRFWRLDDTWERMHAALRERVRVHLKRKPQPSAGIVEHQPRARPSINLPRTPKKWSGHSTWGMWPQLGMRASEPSRRRATASLAWDSGNTRSRAPQTTSVGIFRVASRSTSTSR